jgi:hypothetical protein
MHAILSEIFNAVSLLGFSVKKPGADPSPRQNEFLVNRPECGLKTAAGHLK